MDEDELLRWLDAEVHVKITTPEQMFYLGVELKAENKIIGYIGLRFTDPLQAILLVVFNRKYQRKGFAVEALRAVVRFCFKEIKLHRLIARTDSQNTAALKLFEHVGMRREAEFVKDTAGPDGWHSSVSYAILEEEFLKSVAG